jgi:hypothetical protein
MTDTGLLPGYTMRALHSAYLDALLTISPPDAQWRDALIGRTDGATFRALLLALSKQSLVVTHRTDERGELHLGIGVPTNGHPVRICELREGEHGMSLRDFVGMQMHDLDGELETILNGGDQ